MGLASSPDPLSTEPTATVSARGALMLPLDTELDMESPSPPPLRTATTFMDMNWPLDTPSASLIPVLPDLSSRGPSSTLATARGPLSPSTEEQLLLRTTTTFTDTSLALDIPSASPTQATLGLPSMSQGFIPTFCCLTAQASATKDLSYLFFMLLLPNTY